MIPSWGLSVASFYKQGTSWGHSTSGASPMLSSEICKIANKYYSGAGSSEGRTSWTGKPELGDYVSLYGFMLNYLQELHSTLASRQNTPPTEAIHLVIGGYSFGSLIASHVPPLDVMLDLFCNGPTTPTTPIYEIGSAAQKIAAQSTRHLPPAKQNPDQDNQADQPTSRVVTTISYLLVSPLLPPVSQLLTAFSALSVSVGGKSSAQARPAGRPAEQLSAHRTLALFGDQDTFTSARKLQRWSAEMARMSQSGFTGCEIEGAGHFWRENGVETRARRALQEWLQSRS
jgi:alpha/beta superfamily hydrolase